MKLAYFLGPFCALALNATGAVVIQSVTTSWTGTVSVERAISLGGGSDTAGQNGFSTDPTHFQAFGGHAQVGPDYADIGGDVSVTSSEGSVRARYAYSVTGQIEHPSGFADNGTAQMNVSMIVDIAFVLDRPTEVGLSTTAAVGDLVQAAVFDPGGAFTYMNIIRVGNGSEILPAGSYRAQFLYIGQAIHYTSWGGLDLEGIGEFQLTVPEPGVLALSAFMLCRRSRRRS
ncbi:MAG: hypothetical protein HUU18_09610 [Phycisphaerales bacterium]|nr:hypothetical protein [Phycisphaerales bacterium]